MVQKSVDRAICAEHFHNVNRRLHDGTTMHIELVVLIGHEHIRVTKNMLASKGGMKGHMTSF